MPPQLPPPLREWAPFLDLFPLESALGLGPLVRRLDGFIGPLRASPQSGSVEPDGFDGISRRGRPERLLLSEWLLADEAPLEFLRRLSQNESAFTQLARRDPFAARSSLALFDCGPDSLGGPRLAALAALLVLARRAGAAGASFRWGVWQLPGQWQDEVSRRTLEWWLDARGRGEPSPGQREEWEAQWAREGADFGRDELWLVGSASLAQFKPERARLLEIGDELDPFAPDHAVGARLDGRDLRLVLPEDAIGARLIRDPFAQTLPPKTSDANSFDIAPIDRGLVWAQSGWKMFARTADGNLLVFSVPNSPSAKVGPPKKHPMSGIPLAVGRVGRATVAVAVSQTFTRDGVSSVELRFSAWGRNSSEWDDQKKVAQSFLVTVELEVARALPMGQIIGIGSSGSLALYLSNQRFAVASKGKTDLSEEPRNVLGVAGIGDSAVSVLLRDGESAILRSLQWKDGAAQWHETHLEAGFNWPRMVRRAFCGWGGQPNAPLWALQNEGPHWTLLQGTHLQRFFFESAHEVVGCVAQPDGKSGLLLATFGERDLFLRPDATHEELVCHFSSPIESVAVCPFAPLVAIQGERELGVWSLGHRAWLLRARWE